MLNDKKDDFINNYCIIAPSLVHICNLCHLLFGFKNVCLLIPLTNQELN